VLRYAKVPKGLAPRFSAWLGHIALMQQCRLVYPTRAASASLTDTNQGATHCYALLLRY
jgi:hypothetical protein